MKNVKLKGALALLLAVLLMLSLSACNIVKIINGGDGPNTEEPNIEEPNTQTQDSKPQTEEEARPIELTSIGTFDDVYGALLSYAQTSINEVLVEQDETLDKLYGIYPPGSQGTMIYDPYIKMSVSLNEDGSLAHWGIGLPYNKDWVADGTLTASEALGFGKLIMRGTMPEMSDEQFEEMLKSLQWPSEEEFTEAVISGVDPGTAGGALIIVGGGESLYTITLMFNESNSQFSLIFSKDL